MLSTYAGMKLMIAKMTKPSRPTSTMPAPAIFEIFENSSHEGVLASLSTRTYDARSSLTSMLLGVGRAAFSIFPTRGIATERGKRDATGRGNSATLRVAETARRYGSRKQRNTNPRRTALDHST